MAPLRASQLTNRVERILDRLRPGLVSDGGNVELLEVSDDGTVRVALQGACASCQAIHIIKEIKGIHTEDKPQDGKGDGNP